VAGTVAVNVTQVTASRNRLEEVFVGFIMSVVAGAVGM